ncbi:MAG TPA: hypothetical protein VGF84_06200 [Micromonosporaceae bacterium]|jgi:hypothetical protein
MWGIAGYDPVLSSTANDVFAAHGARLGSLVGRPLTGVCGLAFRIDGSWSHAGPVILEFDGPCLEVLAEGFDTLYLSWDVIDVTTPITQDDDPELALDWARLDLPEIGSAVTGVRILETYVRLTPDDSDPIEAWLLAGLEFVVAPGDRAIQLVNALDALRLSTEPPASDTWRRRTVN